MSIPHKLSNLAHSSIVRPLQASLPQNFFNSFFNFANTGPCSVRTCAITHTRQNKQTHKQRHTCPASIENLSLLSISSWSRVPKIRLSCSATNLEICYRNIIVKKGFGKNSCFVKRQLGSPVYLLRTSLIVIPHVQVQPVVG